MRIEVERNGMFRFFLEDRDFMFGAREFLDWLKIHVPDPDRRYDAVTRIRAIDVKYKDAVIAEMMATFVPGTFELTPVEHLETWLPKKVSLGETNHPTKVGPTEQNGREVA